MNNGNKGQSNIFEPLHCSNRHYGTKRDKLGHGNGLYLVTDPRKCLIHSIQHSTENPCVRGSIPRGATPVTVVNKGLPEI